MSVERGQAAGAAAATAGHAAARGGAGGRSQAPAAPGDFLALLAALEESLPATLATGLQDEGDAPGATPAQDPPAALAPDTAPVPADAALVGVLAPPMPLVTTDAASEPVPVGTAAQALAREAAPVTPAGVAAPAPGTTPLAALAAAVSAQQAPAADESTGTLPEPPRAAPALPAGAAPAVAAVAVPLAPAPMLAAHYASVLEQLALKNRMAGQDGVQQNTTTAMPAAGAPLQQTALAEARRDRQGAWPALSLGPATSASTVAAATAAVAAADAPAPRASRSESAGAPGGPAMPLWDFRPTVQHELAPIAVPAPPATDPGQLADQVSYWAAQGLRGADLTVHGDADAVQVRIALDGQEARIEFRSEHAATREWLASSTDQLRELLQREGVVLAGVSVGAHQAGQQQRQPSPAPAPTRPVAAGARGAAAVAPAAAPVTRGPAGTVDLFV